LLTDLIEANPRDANSHFWFGYITYILFDNKETAKMHLQMAKTIEPKLFYSDLVLAGLSGNQQDEIAYLESVLEEKPNLYRGLEQLSDVLIQLGQYDNAKSRLRILLNSSPYHEKDYGLMNSYINDVLTGESHQWEFKRRAEMTINTLP
jgi:tetratricopeptide (TPR) repeat protein